MLSIDDLIGVKVLTRRAIEDVGSQARCASLTRVRRAAFSEYINEADESHVIRFDSVTEIDRYLIGRGRDPHFLPWLADFLGFKLIRLQIVRKGKTAQLARLTGRAMREVGDFCVEMSKALEDDHITAAEDETVEARIDRAVTTLLETKEMIRAVRAAESANGDSDG